MASCQNMAPETGHISEAAEEMAALGGALEARAGWPSIPYCLCSFGFLGLAKLPRASTSREETAIPTLEDYLKKTATLQGIALVF